MDLKKKGVPAGGAAPIVWDALRTANSVILKTDMFPFFESMHCSSVILKTVNQTTKKPFFIGIMKHSARTDKAPGNTTRELAPVIRLRKVLIRFSFGSNKVLIKF